MANPDKEADSTYRLPPIPWHRRLSLRLALVFGAAILAFNTMREPLFNAAWNLVYPEESEEAVPEALSGPQAIPRHFEEILLALPPGTNLSEHAIEEFANPMREQYYSFAWIAQDGSLNAVPNDIKLETGRQWKYEFGPFIPIVRENSETTSGSAYMEGYPLDGGRGTLVLISIDPGMDANMPLPEDGVILPMSADSPLLNPYTSEEDEALRFMRLQKFVSIGVAVILAALLALMVAWFISRRIARLARDARNSLEDQTSAQPFRISGHDEISSLAKSLNNSRERMTGLLKEVENRDRTRREWIAQVSHDIRTPLTALAACIDRAEGKTIGVAEPGLRTELSLMLHTAKADLDRLNTLTKDLLESARLDLDESLAIEEVLPAELLRHLMTSIRSYAQSQRVAIETDIPRGLPILSGDGNRLMRAFENLVKNAIQHANSKVVISLEADEAEFRFIVNDDGEGLPERDGKVILVAKGKNPDKQDSSGLGLIVTRKIVEAHSGTLSGHNHPDGGARIVISLPIEADPEVDEE